MPAYFIHDGQAELGPFTYEELRAKVLNYDTPVWYEGLEKWTTIGCDPALASLLTIIPTPPPFKKNADSDKTDHKEAPDESYATAMQEYFPASKRKSNIPLLIVGLIIIGGFVAWLITKDSRHSETISLLQDQVSTQQAIMQQKEVSANLIKQEEERTKAAIAEKNMKYRNNWDRLIKVNNSEPVIDYTLGGISSFNVYVTNETDYILDEVDVYIQYIRKSGEVWQTQTIRFLNVAPNSRERGVAPASVNGVKVGVNIQKIISKKMEFCYPVNNGNPSDPYFCR